MSGKEGEFFKF